VTIGGLILQGNKMRLDGKTRQIIKGEVASQFGAEAVVRLFIKLGGRKVDVLIKDPLKPQPPIHEQALRQGIIL
jgi:hypothetical protein